MTNPIVDKPRVKMERLKKPECVIHSNGRSGPAYPILALPSCLYAIKRACHVGLRPTSAIS